MRNDCIGKVGAVVVTYNRLALLKECIEALRNQTYTDCEIVVVNNGCTDDTPKWLEEQHDLHMISQDNLGGAGGFHTGMKYAAETGFKYCWVMDDDVICRPDALQELVDALSVKDNIGFVCSQCVGMDGAPLNVPGLDMRPTINGYPYVYEHIGQQMLKVRTATFASVLFPCSVIHEVGLPIKEYFIWGDDMEYTARVSQRYECYFVCKSVVIHKRKEQSCLCFDTEKDATRLKMFYYYIRNNGRNDYNGLTPQQKFLFLSSKLYHLLGYLSRGDMLRASILTRAVWDMLHFRPSIQFPEKK